MPAGSCGAGTSLWNGQVRNSLLYRERYVLNVGFASGRVTMEQVEAGEASRNAPGSQSEALVAFVRAIGLKAGDVQHLLIRAPDGQVIVEHTEAALDRNKAQYLLFAGKRRPPAGWPAGRYQAIYSINRNGRIELDKTFEIAF